MMYLAFNSERQRAWTVCSTYRGRSIMHANVPTGCSRLEL